MEKLAEISHIRDKIKAAPKPAIKALHLLIFEVEGDRKNRGRLREFAGFNFNEESDEYQRKLTYAGTLTMGDLISVCNILGLSYTGNKEDLRIRIMHGLMNINSLIPNDGEDDDQSSESEDETERESNDANDGQQEPQERNNDVRSRRGDANKTCFSMSYRDVEDSIRSFSGNDEYPIERWIADFEDAAMMFNWKTTFRSSCLPRSHSLV